MFKPIWEDPLKHTDQEDGAAEGEDVAEGEHHRQLDRVQEDQHGQGGAQQTEAPAHPERNGPLLQAQRGAK